MNNKYSITLVLVIGLLLPILLICSNDSLLATSNITTSGDLWEYCEITIIPNGIRYEGPNNIELEVMDEDRYKALAEKLSLRIEKDNSTALLNELGRQKWELVTHMSMPRSESFWYQIWSLKRQVR